MSSYHSADVQEWIDFDYNNKKKNSERNQREK